MMTMGLNGRAFGMALAVALLAGCGGPQTAGLGATQPSARAFDPQQSQRLPGTIGQDLVYATGGCGGVCVVTYPADEFVAGISLTQAVGGDCSDNQGNVFVANDTQVLEFAHGGTSPIGTLSLPGKQATGCSVDTTTGNLAVAFIGNGGDIAIFSHASGTPTLYISHSNALYCGYDGVGNLFADGYVTDGQPGLSELPAGQSQFTRLSISNVGRPGQIQWDGKHITYESVDKNAISVSRLQITGSVASVIGTTHFKNIFQATQSSIIGTKILIPYVRRGREGRPNKVGVFKYPKGGKATKNLNNFGADKKSLNLQGVTLSAGL